MEIAKRYGFAGASPREQAEVLAMVNDFDVFSYYSDVYAEKDEAKKAELKNKVRSVLGNFVLLNFLIRRKLQITFFLIKETKFKLLEKKIKQTNGFIVPSGMTVADLVVFSVYDITTNLVDNTEFFKEIDEKMPILKEYRLRILNETRIQAYINSRPPLSRLGF